MWYQALWKQKATYHFYEVYNAFVSSFKKLIFRVNTSRLSLEASTFLDKKGNIEKMEHYSVVRIYCSREKPLYLPYYVPDRMFSIEVADNTGFGYISSMRKGRDNSFHCHGKLGKFY
jgi:hypothetical protein